MTCWNIRDWSRKQQPGGIWGDDLVGYYSTSELPHPAHPAFETQRDNRDSGTVSEWPDLNTHPHHLD
jgi:hypothetical protein